MENLDAIKLRETKKAEEAQAREQEKQEIRQTLTAVINGEILPDDFEAVEADEGRTFTQDEVNSIIRGRLAKERERYGAAIAEMATKLSGYETALTEREKRLEEEILRFKAEQILINRGIEVNTATIDLVLGVNLQETTKNIDALYTAKLNGQPQNTTGKTNPIRLAMGLN